MSRSARRRVADDLAAAFRARGWEIPACHAEPLHSRRSDHVVIIPVINEGERIRRQLREMAALGLTAGFDTVVVDGGSTDGSLDPAFLREVGLRALLTKTGPGKLSAQLRCGYAWALLEGYAGIITIDGNGKDGVDTLPRFSEALTAGYGYAQASRFRPGGLAEHTPLSRLLAIRLIPAPLLAEYRAAAVASSRGASQLGGAIVVLVWLLAAIARAWWIWPRAGG